MSAEAGGEKKKLSLGAKAKSFFGGVKDALKDAATIDIAFDNQEARLKGVVQIDGAPKELLIFSHDVTPPTRCSPCSRFCLSRLPFPELFFFQEPVAGKIAIAPR